MVGQCVIRHFTDGPGGHGWRCRHQVVAQERRRAVAELAPGGERPVRGAPRHHGAKRLAPLALLALLAVDGELQQRPVTVLVRTDQQTAGERCQGAAAGLLQGTDPRGRGELVGDGLHGNAAGGQVVMQQARGVESLAAVAGAGRFEPGTVSI